MKRILILSNLLIFLVIVCSGLKCKETDSNPVILPETTHTGKNTMGALLNGQVWANDEYPWCLVPNGIDARYLASGLYVSGENLTTFVTVSVDHINGPGQYTILPLNGEASISGAALPPGSTDRYKDYRTDASHSGTVTITYLDLIHHIASGTFTFQAVNVSDPNDIMQVTSGRFDVVFSTN